MPKLYHHEHAWQVPGQQDRKAKRVDVPSTPAELAAWLNDRNVTPEETAALAFAREALAATGRGPLTAAEIEEEGNKPWILGPVTKDPPRVAPAFLGDVAAGAEFIPVTKAAEIDRHLARCPMCHNSEEAAQHRRDRLDFEGIMAWIAERATRLELDDLHDLVEEKRQ